MHTHLAQVLRLAPRTRAGVGLASGALLLLTSCGQADPAERTDSDDTTAPPNVALPAPPVETCDVELACEAAIQDDPKVLCDMVITIGTQRVYEGVAGVEKRGRSSLSFPKPNYAVELREVDGTTNRPVDLFGFGADEDWILDGSWADRSFIRNSLASDLFQSFSADWYAPQAAYCELTLDDEYRGVYRVVERIKQGDARVQLQKDDGQGRSFVIHQDEDGSLRFELGLEGRWDPTYPKEPDQQQQQGIQRWLDELADALRASSDGEDGVFGKLNRQNVIDWLLLQEFSKNVDAYKLSVYLTRDGGGLGQLVPWDLDLAFGQPEVTSGSDALQRNHEPSGWVVERTPFVRDIAAVPGFAAALATRWRQLRGGPLATSVVLRQVAAYQSVIEPMTAANFERWPLDEVRFEQVYGPYHLYEVSSYDDEVSHIETWISARLTWMDANIDDFAEH